MRLPEQLAHQRVAFDAQVCTDFAENRGQRADAETLVIRDGEVMLTLPKSREPQVAAGFASGFVTKDAKGVGELAPGDVPRQLQAAMTSS